MSILKSWRLFSRALLAAQIYTAAPPAIAADSSASDVPLSSAINSWDDYLKHEQKQWNRWIESAQENSEFARRLKEELPPDLRPKIVFFDWALFFSHTENSRDKADKVAFAKEVIEQVRRQTGFVLDPDNSDDRQYLDEITKGYENLAGMAAVSFRPPDDKRKFSIVFPDIGIFPTSDLDASETMENVDDTHRAYFKFLSNYTLLHETFHSIQSLTGIGPFKGNDTAFVAGQVQESGADTFAFLWMLSRGYPSIDEFGAKWIDERSIEYAGTLRLRDSKDVIENRPRPTGMTYGMGDAIDHDTVNTLRFAHADAHLLATNPIFSHKPDIITLANMAYEYALAAGAFHLPDPDDEPCKNARSGGAAVQAACRDATGGQHSFRVSAFMVMHLDQCTMPIQKYALDMKAADLLLRLQGSLKKFGKALDCSNDIIAEIEHSNPGLFAAARQQMLLWDKPSPKRVNDIMREATQKHVP